MGFFKDLRRLKESADGLGAAGGQQAGIGGLGGLLAQASKALSDLPAQLQTAEQLRHVDPDLLANGLLRTATVTEIASTPIAFGPAFAADPVAAFQLQVSGADGQPYSVALQQAIPHLLVGSVIPGSTVFVRVAPTDPQRVAIDFTQAPLPAGGAAVGAERASAAELLASGVSGTAQIQETFSVGNMTAHNGDPVIGLIMQVTLDGRPPYVTKNGQRVPPDRVAALVPGAVLPVKGDPASPDRVVIDWDHATAGA